MITVHNFLRRLSLTFILNRAVYAYQKNIFVTCVHNKTVVIKVGISLFGVSVEVAMNY